MAVLAAPGLTLQEVAKRHDPNGNQATIAEVLAKTNQILDDVPWREANDVFSNVSLKRASLPTGTWRKLNAGVGAEKSETIQIRDVIGILESEAKHDVRVIKSFKNPAQAREDENRSFVSGLGQTMASAIFYANTVTTPEKFTGLAPRMANVAASNNVINEGGTGSDLASIFVVDWGIDTAYMLYPRGSMAGLDHQDMGIQVVQDDSSLDFRAYVDFFSWEAGLTVKNAKSIGRICNIESTGSSNIFDEDNLITLLNRMTKGPGRRIYVNETVMTQMEIRTKDKTNINYTKTDGLAPGLDLKFKGVPIRQCDSLLITEAALT